MEEGWGIKTNQTALAYQIVHASKAEMINSV